MANDRYGRPPGDPNYGADAPYAGWHYGQPGDWGTSSSTTPAPKPAPKPAPAPAPAPTTAPAASTTAKPTQAQLNATALSMTTYMKSIYGTIEAFNARAGGGPQYASWDALQTYFASGNSPTVNEVALGGGSHWTMASWQEYNKKIALNTPTAAVALQAGGPGDPNATAAQRNAFAVLQQTLNDYGLGSLSNWLWGEITNDTPVDQVFLDLRKRPEYQARFPGMTARQQAGLPALTEGQYIQAEESIRSALRQAGYTGDLTQPGSFVQFFKNDLNPDEVKQRADLWHAMTASPEVTGRIKGLFKVYTGLGNVTNDQLFQALVQDNHDLLSQLHIGLTQNGVDTLSIANLQDRMKQAIKEEAATFAGGGGQAGQRGEGLLSREQRQFT